VQDAGQSAGATGRRQNTNRNERLSINGAASRAGVEAIDYTILRGTRIMPLLSFTA